MMNRWVRSHAKSSAGSTWAVLTWAVSLPATTARSNCARIRHRRRRSLGKRRHRSPHDTTTNRHNTAIGRRRVVSQLPQQRRLPDPGRAIQEQRGEALLRPADVVHGP
jgi:hypothetical protein